MRGQNCCDDPEWGNRKANAHMAWPDNCCPGPEAAVYLVSFKEIVLVGGVQYQQNFDLPFGMQATVWGMMSGWGAATGINRGGGWAPRNDLVLLPISVGSDGQARLGPTLRLQF